MKAGNHYQGSYPFFPIKKPIQDNSSTSARDSWHLLPLQTSALGSRCLWIMADFSYM
ncbi:cellulose synthase A catalytic subunit 5 [UDP-forming]-like isoform X1 [Iris pallida]|uniref:Cellulose synthase A catalytic subunit 5 [UDP-forming]-like isoform X1 n=1 Tax=Iris pallida TaxID=29817 RepID=A0AAX6FVV6_IRIPA|nr:cellulose synthase A catalytic subunit 5 [UDP-forming]-like isoform X1 [Iris pallida]